MLRISLPTQFISRQWHWSLFHTLWSFCAGYECTAVPQPTVVISGCWQSSVWCFLINKIWFSHVGGGKRTDCKLMTEILTVADSEFRILRVFHSKSKMTSNFAGQSDKSLTDYRTIDTNFQCCSSVSLAAGGFSVCLDWCVFRLVCVCVCVWSFSVCLDWCVCVEVFLCVWIGVCVWRFFCVFRLVCV